MKAGAGQPRSGTAVAAGPGVPAILGSVDRVDVRRPGLVGRGAAHRRARAARAGRIEMGVLTALQWLPSLLFALHAGAWVDRRGKRRSAMILADLGRAAAFATIPLCYALHVLTFAQMCVVTFVAGRAVGAVHRVGRDAVRVDRAAGGVRRRPVADLRQPGAVLPRRAVGRRAAGAGAERRRTPSWWTRCRSSARPSSSASIRPAEPPAADGEDGRHGRAAVHRRLADRPGVADRRGGGQLLQPDVRGAVHALRGARSCTSGRGCSAR